MRFMAAGFFRYNLLFFVTLQPYTRIEKNFVIIPPDSKVTDGINGSPLHALLLTDEDSCCPINRPEITASGHFLSQK